MEEGREAGNTARILKFSADGTFIKEWGQIGVRHGEFRTPHGLAFDSQGRLWVSCVASHPHAKPGIEPRDSIIVLEDLDKDYLRNVLKRYDGHLGRTAKHAGIHRKSLYNKIKRYGIKAGRGSDD